MIASFSLTLVLLLIPSLQVKAKLREACLSDTLAIYRVIMNTHWSKKEFPKHYPLFRPPAQFAKLIGISHDKAFSLFELNQTASDGVKIFAETGALDLLDQLGQGEQGVYDEFIAPPVLQGVGRTDGHLFLDGNHSRVSLISRIVPSPDWFVGISSYDLCSNGRWVDSVMIEVDPLDAGSDNGLTFTSPNWPTEPRGKISRLSPRNPIHPASSFYYGPDKETLPPIASFKFLKMKEYFLSEIFRHSHRDSEILDNEVTKVDNRPEEEETNLKSVLGFSSLSNRMGPQEEEESDNIIEYVPFPEKKRSRERRRKLKKFRPPRDCIVSDWGPWTVCSKKCGLGEMTRERFIISHPRRGGRQCPSLKQAKWCGSARSCGRSYFNWATNRW